MRNIVDPTINITLLFISIYLESFLRCLNAIAKAKIVTGQRPTYNPSSC